MYNIILGENIQTNSSTRGIWSKIFPQISVALLVTDGP